MAPDSKNRTIAGAVKDLFREAVKILARDDGEAPPPRRRRDETEGDFRRWARKAAHRFDARAQFRAAAEARARRLVRTLILSAEEWGAPDAHRHNAFDLLAHLNNEVDSGNDCGFDTVSNHIGPQL